MKAMLSMGWIAVLTFAFLMFSCQSQEATKDGDKKVEKKEVTEKANTAPKDGKDDTKGKKMEKPKKIELAGSHILFSYMGASRAKPTVKATKDEAKKKAEEVLALLEKDPSKFEELAKQYSDCPSSAKGGDLGTWQKGRMTPAFDNAIMGMKVGQISKLVETPFGFHIIKRNEVVAVPEFAGSHILIPYKGAMRAPANVTRSKDEAKKEAERLLAELKKDPTKFPEVAKQNSSCPSSAKGGDLGKWKKGQMVPEFDKAIEKLKTGEVSEVIETPFGFHIIRRN